jgi:hypothetical protein
MAVNDAEATGDYAGADAAFGLLGIMAMMLRLGPLAERYFERARRTTDPGALAQAAVSEGSIRPMFGQWAAGEALLREAYAGAVPINDTTRQAYAAEACGVIDAVRNPPAALALHEDLVALARRTGNVHHEIWGLAGVSAARLARGDVAEAGAALDLLEERLSDVDAVTWIRYRALRAGWALGNGDPRRAADEADEALKLCRGARFHPPDVFAALAALAETCLALAEAPDAPQPAAGARAESACRALAAFARGYPAAKPRSLRLDARRAQRAGRTGQARRLYGRALALARKLDTPFDEAGALGSLADLEPAGPTAAAQRADAAAILARLAAEPGLRLAEPEPAAAGRSAAA